MQLSVADWCFYSEHYLPADYYRTLAEMGIHAVEMVAEERRPIARDASLTILNLAAPGMADGLNDPAYHATLLPRIREMITEARDAGIPQLILFSGNRTGRSDVDGANSCIDALRLLAPLAESAGITLLFEMLNPHDHPDYQADHTAFGVKVVTEVASPAVRLLYDIYHMYRQREDVASDLLTYAGIIGHIHLAQSPRRTAPHTGAPIDYARLIAHLHAADYRGHLGLEYLPEGDPLEELHTVCRYFDPLITNHQSLTTTRRSTT